MSYNKNMTKDESNKKLGTMQAIAVAFHQGFEGVLFTLILMFVTLVPSGEPSAGTKAAFSAAGLGAKELIALILVVIWTLYKHGPKFFKTLFFKWRTKQGAAFIAAGMIGTSFGNLFYILGVVFAGAGYGAVLTALYPVFSMILVKLVMKEKEPKLVWVGVVIAVIGGFLMILLPILVDGDSFSPIKIVGMIFGLVAAFFWALEGLFINMGIKAKTKNPFTRHEIIITRNIFTSITTFALIMPIILVAGNSFHWFSVILTNWQPFLVMFAIAVNIIILRFLHVSAIKNVGPKVTAIIDTNNFIVPAIIAQIFIAIPVLADRFANSTIDWWAYFLLIPIMIGVTMVIYFHKEEPKEMPLDSVHWETPEKVEEEGK